MREIDHRDPRPVAQFRKRLVAQQPSRLPLDANVRFDRQFGQHILIELFPNASLLQRLFDVRHRVGRRRASARVLIFRAEEMNQHQLMLGLRLLHRLRVVVEPNERLRLRGFEAATVRFRRGRFDVQGPS